MKRLTRKIKGANNYCEFELKDQPYKSFLDIKRNSDLEWLDVCDLTLAIDKLGQLEDIEKELGIDLITLFAVFEQGLYFIKNNEIFRVEPIDISIQVGEDPFKLFFIVWYYNELDEQKTTELDFEDYGKIWSLDRSELEND